MGSDDDAVKQIRRRVSPFGWLVILAVLGVGGGTTYYMLNSAIQESRDEREKEEGRLELSRILQQNLPTAQTAEQVRAVYGRYHSESVRMSARRILAGLKDPQSVPMLIEGLSTEGVSRAQSALGLAEIGLPAAESAKAPLLAALARTDPQRDRAEVAWALVALGESSAWPQVREMLEANRLQSVLGLDQRRVFDPALVARMAGKDRLVELSRSNNNASKRLAALSLAELASPDLVDPLTALSRDSDLAVAREAAVGLGRTGDPRASDAIMAFLAAHPDEREGVLAALATSAGAQGLAVVIHGARDLQTRATATRLLRDQKDPDAGDALFEAMGAATGTDDVSTGMRRNAVFGLAEIGDARAVDGLMTYATAALTHQDSNATQDAKLALEQIRHIPGAGARAKAGLLEILRSPQGDFARTPAMLALATTGDATLGSVLSPFLAQPDAQEGAAVALCALRLPDCQGRVLSQVRQPPNLRMVEETVRDEPVFVSRRNAIRGLAWLGYPGAGNAAPLPAATRTAAVRELKRIVEDTTDRRALREEAGYSLAAVADDATLTEIATRATDTTVPEETRYYYVLALRGRSTPAISNRLVQTYLRRGVNPDLMKAAAITAGFGADESTSELLVPMLAGTDAQDANLRFAAAIAISIGGNARAANALLDVLATNDELAGTLQNEFVPRGSNPNAATAQENWSLLPVTAAMFDDGRMFRRIEVAGLLEGGRANKHFGYALTQLSTRLRAGWENALGLGPHEVRAKLREAALGTDEYRRDRAFQALRALNDRGSLLSLRRQTRNPAAAERARRELLAMSSAGGAS